MKRILFALVLSLLAASTVFAQNPHRKKVGVVLSGGGAKGAAHVRALKVIEEAGIPVDYVVGTSIGSLVGGLYASGYNADQIDSIMHSQKWMQLLADITPRKALNLAQRMKTDKYILRARFDKHPFEVIEGGLLKGNNIAKLFAELTADTPDSMDYNKLKIPFACVATDIMSGEEIDIHSGVLAESMRASMAIPSVFSPIRKGERLLVDGGMVNNYPVDLAKKMGADVIIGVDLKGEGSTANDVTAAPAVLSQIVDMLCATKHDENVALTDVYIRVDVSGYHASSFTDEAIDSLMSRGEVAARSKWDELIALRNTLGLDAPCPKPAPRALPANMADAIPPVSIYKERFRNSFIGLGARFDNEELASLLIGGLYEFNHKNHLSAGVEARLGKSLAADLYGAVNLGKSWEARLMYAFERRDIRLHDHGKRIADELFRGHTVGFDLSRNWKNVRASFGAEFKYCPFDEVKSDSTYKYFENNESEKSVSYYARLMFDNRNAKFNATRGLTWSVGYRYFTDNGAKFEGGAAMHILDANFSIALPLSRTTTLTPAVAGRWLPSKNNYFTQENFIGGVGSEGHYMPQQISFAGVNYLQMVKNNLLVAGLTLRQHLTTNNYVFAVANYGEHKEKVFSGKDVSRMVGAAIGYGYKTHAGPIEANFNWSNVTKKVGFTINLGYMF